MRVWRGTPSHLLGLALSGREASELKEPRLKLFRKVGAEKDEGRLKEDSPSEMLRFLGTRTGLKRSPQITHINTRSTLM